MTISNTPKASRKNWLAGFRSARAKPAKRSKRRVKESCSTCGCCFVNNNSFVTEKTFDGMRKELAKDFDLIYVLDLGGNVREEPETLRHDAQRLRHPGRRQHQSFLCEGRKSWPLAETTAWACPVS